MSEPNYPPSYSTYAGWRLDGSAGPRQITSDRESNAAAQEAIAAYALSQGLSVRDIPFYVLKQTVTYEPIAKVSFSVKQNVELAEPAKAQF